MMLSGPLALRLTALGAVMAVAAAPSVRQTMPLPASATSTASAAAEIEKVIHTSLTGMSTGVEQLLVVAGSDAEARNALIPVVDGPQPTLSAYGPIAPGTSQYGTALRCMTQAVYYEAANEPEAGKRAVAQVVMNRMRHPAYPNSVCGVVYQGVNLRVCQFSFTCDGALSRKPLARQWGQAAAVAQRALSGEQFTPVGTATHYHANYVLPKWAFTLDKVQVIGAHIFYRFPGRGGRSGAFRSRWANVEAIPHINRARFASVSAEVTLPDGDEEISELYALPEFAEEEVFVPGLTVVPDKKDRHATNDVGGRLDTTKEWRLTIPDPIASKGKYEAMVAGQSSGQKGGLRGEQVQAPLRTATPDAPLEAHNPPPSTAPNAHVSADTTAPRKEPVG